MLYSAHSVLLGPNYTLKTTCLSWATYHFDESYASRSHNGNKIWFFTYVRWRTSQIKLFFLLVPSLWCAHFRPMKAPRTIQLVAIRSPGTSQSNQGRLEFGQKHAVQCISFIRGIGSTYITKTNQAMRSPTIWFVFFSSIALLAAAGDGMRWCNFDVLRIRTRITTYKHFIT